MISDHLNRAWGLGRAKGRTLSGENFGHSCDIMLSPSCFAFSTYYLTVVSKYASVNINVAFLITSTIMQLKLDVKCLEI